MKREQWLSGMPWGIVAVAGALIALGWLAIHRSQQLASPGAGYFQRQVIWSILGMAAMFLTTLPNYRILTRWSYAAFALSLLLLALVYCFPPVNGARRWLRVAGLGVQPSEFAKLAFVLGLARYLMHRASYRQLSGLIPPLLFTMVPLLLVLKEPDLGTALVFLPVLFVMLYAAGARLSHLALLTFMALLMLPVLWSQMSREQKSRMTALAPQSSAADRPSDDGYHLHQAKQMLALGGAWGSLVQGDAAEDRGVYSVPEPHTDSIFSVIGERFGLWGLALVLLLFVLLARQGLKAADATREPFGRLVAIGIVALIAFQVLINTGMMVGLLPITGLALPLVSYGGSSLLANCIAVGLLMNIALRPGYEVGKEPFRFAD